MRTRRTARLDYGLSSFDTRQRMIAYFVYDLPFGPNRIPRADKASILNQLVGGWTVSGITNARTGFPFTVCASSDIDFTGLNRWTLASGFSDRVDLKPGVKIVPQNMGIPIRPLIQAFSAFRCPEDPANAGRNTLIGPHFIDQDFALLRDIPIKENVQLQLRAEFFNRLNHTNFKLPENRLDQSVVGRIGDSYDSRLTQLSVRVQW